MLDTIIIVLLWAFSLLSVAFFSASETAYTKIDDLTIKELQSEGRAGAETVAALYEDKKSLLSSLLIATNGAIVLSTVLANLLLKDTSIGKVSGATLATWGMVALILIFGEALPKRYAAGQTVRVALWAGKPNKLTLRLLKPLSTPLLRIPHVLGRRLALPQESNTMDEEALLTLVDMGEEAGALEQEERDMIVAVLESNHTQAREIMTPRVDMMTIPVDAPLSEVWDDIIASGYSRIPVHKGDRDSIVGILYVKDLLPYAAGESEPTISELMREAYFVPSTKRINDLLEEFKTMYVHVAIVVDEYGGTDGIITIEDLLEEIVGEIQDEFDEDEQAPVKRLGPDTWSLDAALPIDEVGELLDVELPDDEVDTIGGLVYWLLDHIPVQGESLAVPDYGMTITVTDINGQRIERLTVKLNA